VPTAAELREEFLLDPTVTFLNHGSYGACPRAVLERYQAWQRELEREPVEFLGRRLPDLLAEARARLATEVGAGADDLVFVPNATSAVNVAARGLRLEPGDEVLATDLEYGACDLLWEHVCAEAGARYVRAPIPLPLTSADDVVSALFARRSRRTRAVFVSHVTSETALVLPVEAIVAQARAEGLATIVDGAHAPGHVPLDLAALNADVYAGNCHKWICAPKGAGFLHAGREWQVRLGGIIVGWGYSDDGGTFRSRGEEQGTRDPSAYLSVPAALDWLAARDWETVRERCRRLVREARDRLAEVTGLEPLAPDDFNAQMASVPLPPGYGKELQARLFDERRVEVPVYPRDGRPLLRVSIQGYNDERDVDALLDALRAAL
jgi:isopenicillin-N epimerase